MNAFFVMIVNLAWNGILFIVIKKLQIAARIKEDSSK
jgi:hypothetical protein